MTQTEVAEYLRGNLHTPTPPIFCRICYKKEGVRRFQSRLVLAATLSSVYGIYSGYELCEATPVPGKEEYLHSEKYDYKVWDWDRPGNITEYVTTINRIRREHPALHEYDNLQFFPCDDDNILCYGKTTADRTDIVVVAANLDPFSTHETTLTLPLAELGIDAGEPYRAHDLLSGETTLWTGPQQRLRLDPKQNPARLFALEPWQRIDYDDPSG